MGSFYSLSVMKEFSDFPMLIDPVSSSLEILRRDADEVRWVRLQKLELTRVMLPPAMNNRAVHFFAEHTNLDDCDFVAVYDAGGVARFFMYRTEDSDQWTIDAVPEEMNGRIVYKPSVRFTFDDEEDCLEFSRLADEIRQRLVSNKPINKRRVDDLIHLLPKASVAQIAIVGKDARELPK